MDRTECSYLSIGGGCKECIVNAKRGGMSCWDWAKQNDEFIKAEVQKKKEAYGIDGVNKAYCDDCHVIYDIKTKKVFYDDYVESWVFRCSKCGQMIPVTMPDFVV